MPFTGKQRSVGKFPPETHQDQEPVGIRHNVGCVLTFQFIEAPGGNNPRRLFVFFEL